MQDQGEPVKRRKRAPREEIPDGEFRNITFRAGSRAYNALVRAANDSGYSISEVAERLIESTISNSTKYVSHTRPHLSDKNEDIIEKIAMVLNVYEKSGGPDWVDYAPNRIAANCAINAIADILLPIPREAIKEPLGEEGSELSKMQTAVNVGYQFGKILADPTNFRGNERGDSDTSSQNKNKS